MSRLARSGARSRKSIATLSPRSARYSNRNPPPPIPVDCGRSTLMANEAATAASTALPPRRSMSAPASLAAGLAAATMPCRAVVTKDDDSSA